MLNFRNKSSEKYFGLTAGFEKYLQKKAVFEKDSYCFFFRLYFLY